MDPCLTFMSLWLSLSGRFRPINKTKKNLEETKINRSCPYTSMFWSTKMFRQFLCVDYKCPSLLKGLLAVEKKKELFVTKTTRVTYLPNDLNSREDN